ncbi:MAG: TetR family transcriptional regulator [Anaerolineae bacterium]
MLLTETQLDPRVARTRELLGQAVMDLLSEKEFGKITVQDITARAGVNRATFYAHFEDKYMLMDYLLRNQFQTMLHNKLGCHVEFSEASLRALTQVACEFLDGFAGHCMPSRDKNDAVMEAQVQACLHDVLLGWLEPLRTTINTTPEIIATVVSWAIFGSVSQWAHSRKRISAELVTEQVSSLLITGLHTLL